MKTIIRTTKFILTNYIEKALDEAIYEKIEDGTFVGKIPNCEGVVAFAESLRECERELRSTLEEWILLGLKLKHFLPIIADIDLNKEFQVESIATM
jgi:predicted RNase H-like HicB family nuclease